jgi:4-alpha-glucanotransferase
LRESHFLLLPAWQYDDIMSLKKREEILWDSHHTPSLFHINLLNEYLAIDPALVHKDTSKERINVPGKVEDSNWSYRILPNLEDVSNNENVKAALKRIIAK